MFTMASSQVLMLRKRWDVSIIWIWSRKNVGYSMLQWHGRKTICSFFWTADDMLFWEFGRLMSQVIGICGKQTTPIKDISLYFFVCVIFFTYLFYTFVIYFIIFARFLQSFAMYYKKKSHQQFSFVKWLTLVFANCKKIC